MFQPTDRKDISNRNPYLAKSSIKSPSVTFPASKYVMHSLPVYALKGNLHLANCQELRKDLKDFARFGNKADFVIACLHFAQINQK